MNPSTAQLKEKLTQLQAWTDEELDAALRNEYEKLIAARAYKIYQKRMETGQDGSADQDWYQAEAEMPHVA